MDADDPRRALGTDPDADLTAALRRLLAQRDGPPPSVWRAAEAAWSWRTVDAELAELVHDSVVHAGDVRGADGGDTRTVAFEVDDRGVELEIDTHGDRRRLVGQLLPPARGHVEIHAGGGEQSVTVDVDDRGRFQADDLPHGPMQLVCRPDDGAPVTTTWVNI